MFPVQKQIFHQEGPNYHAHAVVDVPGFPQFTHSGINNWVPGLSPFPKFQQPGVFFPGKCVKTSLQIPGGQIGKMIKKTVGKLPPSQFTEKMVEILAGVLCLGAIPGLVG